MSGVTAFQLLGKLAIDGVDETKKALNDVSKGGKDAEKKLKVSFQEIGAKAGELGKSIVTGLSVGIAGILATYEATKEFRQDFGKLTTTFETTNQAAGVAEETFKTLFGVLGEDDTAIETANHLAMMTNNEKDLAQWTDVLTGVYATFGDSLPLEGLAEAANETARVGQVTGPLADALNWAGVSEDEFNKKLEKTNSTAERERLIRETLNGLYGEASATYKDVNGNVIANNEAQAELNMKLADTMAKVEPLITELKLFMADVLVKLQPIITWIIDNISILAPIVLGFLGTLFALNIASKIQALIPIIKALNTTMKANPIGLIITIIGLLVTAFITLWNNCEGFRNFWIGLWDNLKKIVSGAIDGIVSFFTKIIDFVKNNWQGLLLLILNPFAGAFKLLYDNCDGFREFVDKWIKKIKDFFVNGFKSIKEKVVTTFTNFKNGIVNIATSIKDGIVTRITNLKNGVVNTFNNIKNTATNIFNKVKTAITSPIEKARDVVKKVIDKIKGFFNFNVSLPKIKLPHFSIKPSGWKLGDLLEGSIPKLGIEWYAKAMKNPMLLDEPTAFGYSASGNIRVGGEAGKELVGGANTVMGMISDAVDNSNSELVVISKEVLSLLYSYLPVLAQLQVRLDTGELVGALASPMDVALGELAFKKGRGY